MWLLPGWRPMLLLHLVAGHWVAAMGPHHGKVPQIYNIQGGYQLSITATPKQGKVCTNGVVYQPYSNYYRANDQCFCCQSDGMLSSGHWVLTNGKTSGWWNRLWNYPCSGYYRADDQWLCLTVGCCVAATGSSLHGPCDYNQADNQCFTFIVKKSIHHGQIIDHTSYKPAPTTIISLRV